MVGMTVSGVVPARPLGNATESLALPHRQPLASDLRTSFQYASLNAVQRGGQGALFKRRSPAER